MFDIQGVRTIRFQDQAYLWIPGGAGMGAAIATPEQFESFELSYAHCFPDGIVRRFNEPIGTIEEIQFLGERE